jgi:hypothetical protein
MKILVGISSELLSTLIEDFWIFSFFSGAFAEFRKTAISFVMSVCPSVRPPTSNNSVPTWQIFMKFEYLFSKICGENSSLIRIWQEWLVLYMNAKIIFLSYLAYFFLEWDTFQTKVIEKFKTHLCLVTFFFEIRAFYEIMWKNIVEDRPQMTIWCMVIARWIPKTINSHPEYVILIVVLLQQWLNDSASMLHHSTLSVLLILGTGCARATV